ncbi:hypothetical protein B9G53_22515 [Pseudanabaena sp. SR411]|uniref:hypothetical protein n=1 Tax=Pseudanabaena sp. SR411 TaxID=1980935 RepID=UPI000B9822F6|nr:hypothetical protein [Pseudanabaena sp. SR411]OYQ62397.1 hypothetical protein B9G53_22515 [Pseudanabaena sp. SR411]
MKLNCQEFQENYSSCTVCQQGTEIPAFDKKNKKIKYILQNPSRRKVCKVQIDDCVITSQTQRKCDYLMIVCESKLSNQPESVDLYFIELKGRDLMSAVEQLTETIKYFQSEKYKFTGKVFARAVVTRVHIPTSSIDTDARVLSLRKLLKKLGGDFAYGSVQFEKDRI